MKFVRFLLAATSLLVPSAANADKAADNLASGLATSSAKFGISIVRGVIQTQPAARYIPPPDFGAAGPAIADVITDYRDQRGRLQGNITIIAGTVDTLADIAAGATVYGTGGAGAIPVMMVRAAVQAGTDDYFSGAREKADESMRAFLARSQTKILSDTKLSYDQLRTRKPEEIRDLLDKGTRTFKDLDATITDPNVREMARSLVVSSIINTEKATLDDLAKKGAAINDLKGRLGTLEKAHEKLADLTKTALTEQGKSIDAVETEVGRLDKTVAAVDKRLASQEQNMDFVQDFLFDKMPAAQKAATLRTGFMANRFTCPDAGANCDQAKLKDELIARFDAEARVQNAVDTAGKVLESANGVLRIASDLGINTGSAATVVKYGTSAFNAFASFASGNYIGAIASITGAFGSSGPDPMMVFLEQQFKEVNRKLDEVLANQAKLSQQIAQLSENLDRHVAQLNTRFDTIEIRVERVRQLQAASFLQDWQACQTTYNHAMDPANRVKLGYDPTSSSFASVEQASAFGLGYKIEVDACIAVVSARPTSIALANWFGSFLNANTSVNTSDQDLDAIKRDRDDAWALVQDYLGRHHIPLWQAYRMYASPAESIFALRKREAQAVSSSNDACSVNGVLAEDRLRKLLCETAPGNAVDPSGAALNGLRVPMLPTRAINAAGWMMVEQALVDVRQVRPSGPSINANELIAFNPGGPTTTLGEDHSERAMLTLDAATANAAMLHGDLTVDALLEVITSTKEQDEAAEKARQSRLRQARSVLNADEYLLKNVGNAFLQARFGIYMGATKSNQRPGAKAYEKALSAAESWKAGDKTTLLASLFGPELLFERDDQNRVLVQLLPQEGNEPRIMARMPEPLAFASGRLFYPEVIRQLEETRELVGSRLLDYRAFRNIPFDKRLTLIKTVARAELSRPKVSEPKSGQEATPGPSKELSAPSLTAALF